MPRNGSGVYSLPGTYEAVSGETIEAQQHNDPLEDMESDANAARPIVAGGTGATTAIGAHDAFVKAGGTIASASTIDLDTATGPEVDISGTTTITAVTLGSGKVRYARATGAFQMTAGSSLVINGSTSVNYTTTAGDQLKFVGYGSSVVRVWVISGASATQADQEAATSATKPVTPSAQHFHLGHPKAVIALSNTGNTNPTVTTLYSGLGTITCSRAAAGNYTLTWANAISSGAYIHGTAKDASAARFVQAGGTGSTTTQQVFVFNDSGTLVDPTAVFVTIFGDL